MVIWFLDFRHLLTGPHEPIAHYRLYHSVETPPRRVRSETTERRVSRVLTPCTRQWTITNFHVSLERVILTASLFVRVTTDSILGFLKKKKCNLIQQGLCFSSFQTLHVPRAHSWFFTHCYVLYNVSTKTVLPTERTLWRGNFYTFKSYYFYVHQK